MDFLWCGGGGLVPHAAHRAGFAAALSLLGLPMGAGNFCGGGAGADGEYLDSAAGTVDHWVVADSGRTSFLQNVGSATKIWRGSYRVTAVGLHITRKALAASSLATISGSIFLVRASTRSSNAGRARSVAVGFKSEDATILPHESRSTLTGTSSHLFAMGLRCVIAAGRHDDNFASRGDDVP